MLVNMVQSTLLSSEAITAMVERYQVKAEVVDKDTFFSERFPAFGNVMGQI